MEYSGEKELFCLSGNGRYVLDERISDILFQLKTLAPERAYQDDSTGYTWDEIGMADLFSRFYGSTARFCPEHKSWYTYDGTRWVKDTSSLLISSAVKEFVRIMALYCGEIEDGDKRTEYMKFVGKMGDRRFRDRIIKDAADNLAISATEFDSDPYLINCTNGTYDLKQMRFRMHSPGDYLTMMSNVKYSAAHEDYSDSRWNRFITEVTEDKEKAEYLQKAMGYSLLGSADEDCMFILYGATTRNGKSTLLGAVQSLLGDYSSTAPVTLITKGGEGTKHTESPTPILASLKGRRFVTMAESDAGGRLDESIIKQYTGGEAITAREIYQKPVTFIPQFKLWLSCNDLPAVRDKSIFASDRIRVIEFNRHFTAEEQDKTLSSYFESEEARKGIFYWLLEGYRKYLTDGLVMPKSMQSVIRQYERDNDTILQYLEQKTARDDESSVKGKILYESYKLWAKRLGYFPMGIKKFNAEMMAHSEFFGEKDLVQNYVVYRGIKLV